MRRNRSGGGAHIVCKETDMRGGLHIVGYETDPREPPGSARPEVRGTAEPHGGAYPP